MRIISYKAIAQYTSIHADAQLALDEWYIKAEQSRWSCFAEIRQTFGSVDSIGNNRFVFNIRGNRYRVIAIIIFASQKMYLRFIGTHTEYNKIKDYTTI
ncbi:MAG: type II toxin-antitoxin system HigB family toxin [Prevotellaceae bacterium]|jgi:mRNA interferase HigB|nr:type II toxin-antitoxin system HigB family toxin [Prevotellaceae bacterium]